MCRREDFPDDFTAFAQTGILGFNVPWPKDPRQRRAKILNTYFRPYYVGANNSVHITSTSLKGDSSVFFPNDDAGAQTAPLSDQPPEWIQLFTPTLSTASRFTFSYSQSTCGVLSGPCMESCPVQNYLLQSPYGDWVIKSTANDGATGNVVSPMEAFGAVTTLKVIFQVRIASTAASHFLLLYSCWI